MSALADFLVVIRLQNDLICVEWDVKPYTLTHSLLVLVVPLWAVGHATH